MIISSSPHSLALAQLNPLAQDAEQNAIALELDRVLGVMDATYQEVFPSTAIQTLSRWEDMYALDGAGSLDDRRIALLAAINADSGIAAKHYIALAAAIGYAITIKVQHRVFRAGCSRAGQQIFDMDEIYTWEVMTHEQQAECLPLIELLEDQKIPFTYIRWLFGYGSVLRLDGSWQLNGNTQLRG